ncbi:hypothetical protein SESBI_48966 [Sesbania bispinosa]|nr:hypothetical protein SESBI_48966 [Sesbania bispinosa]
MRATVSSKVAHNKGQESARLCKALLGIHAAFPAIIPAFPAIIPTLQRLTNGSYGKVGTCCELILALKSVNHESDEHKEFNEEQKIWIWCHRTLLD